MRNRIREIWETVSWVAVFIAIAAAIIFVVPDVKPT
jgi:hypothetical protein